MRRLVWALLVILVPGVGLSSRARIWTSETTQDFSSGTAHGVSGLPSGGLELSRRTDKIAGLAEATIYCSVVEKTGAAFFGTGHEGKIFRQDPGKEAALVAT